MLFFFCCQVVLVTFVLYLLHTEHGFPDKNDHLPYLGISKLRNKNCNQLPKQIKDLIFFQRSPLLSMGILSSWEHITASYTPAAKLSPLLL